MKILTIIFWLMSWIGCISYVVWYFYLKDYLQNFSANETLYFVVAILYGIVSFISFIFTLDRYVAEKVSRIAAVIFSIFIYIFSFGLVVAILYAGLSVVPKQKAVQNQGPKFDQYLEILPSIEPTVQAPNPNVGGQKDLLKPSKLSPTSTVIKSPSPTTLIPSPTPTSKAIDARNKCIESVNAKSENDIMDAYLSCNVVQDVINPCFAQKKAASEKEAAAERSRCYSKI